MKLQILNNDSKIDLPARNGDAGYDVYASSDPVIKGEVHHDIFYKSIYHIEYNTNLNVQPESTDGKFNFYLLLYPRSSIIKTNLVLANSVGVIDSGYSGDIKVCFKYIAQPEDMRIVTGETIEGDPASGILTSINPQRIYHKGDKIAQLIPQNHLEKLSIERVDNLLETERSSGGFGSTDNK